MGKDKFLILVLLQWVMSRLSNGDKEQLIKDVANEYDLSENDIRDLIDNMEDTISEEEAKL